MRKIVERIPPEVLMADLENYCQLAISLGATDAKIITTDQVIIDERVLMKCTYPKCPHWGLSIHCPPYAMKPEQTQKVVNCYRYAIFYTMELSPEIELGTDAAARNKNRKQLYEINAKVEAAAFYDGYYLALGFWNGSCKQLFCPDVECAALKTGQTCRAPLKARSAMEAVGMDVLMMATKVGWDVYACGKSIKPEEVPFVRKAGVILIY